MRSKKWTRKKEALLKKIYPKSNTRSLIGQFEGRTLKAIRSRAKVLGLKKELGYGGKFKWTKSRDEWLIKNYPSKDLSFLLNELECSYSALFKRAEILGVKKSEAYLIKKRKADGDKLKILGARHQFKKGCKAHNKGKKQTEFMSADAIERSAVNRFKKGNKPHNELEDGFITSRKDHKTGIVYKYIRINKGEWQLLSRYNYEKSTGETLKENEVVRFKDGNTINCSPDNLEKISMQENLIKNMLSDTSIVKRFLGVKDEALQDEIIDNHNELITLTRNNVKLKMKINERCD